MAYINVSIAFEVLMHFSTYTLVVRAQGCFTTKFNTFCVFVKEIVYDGNCSLIPRSFNLVHITEQSVLELTLGMRMTLYSL